MKIRDMKTKLRIPLIRKNLPDVGQVPGEVVHVGEKKDRPVRISLIDYDPDGLNEREIADHSVLSDYKNSKSVSWVNFDGVHNPSMLERVAEQFQIHTLVAEDIANTTQRPKFEEYDGYLFMVLKMLTYDGDSNSVRSEQVSLILMPGMVFSFQEEPGDVFEFIRQRIRSGRGRIRKMAADYLAYCLIDAIVDNYFVILERLAEATENISERLMNNNEQNALHDIYHLRSELIFLRKSVWPLRESVLGLEKTESRLIDKRTRSFLRDLYDHTVQVIETVETLREVISSLMDLYLTSVSNRTNDAMKVLTVIATIFIPLSFFAGVFGMNFENMPELGWKFMYPWLFWPVMIAIAGIMIIFFKVKKWF